MYTYLTLFKWTFEAFVNVYIEVAKAPNLKVIFNSKSKKLFLHLLVS